MSFEIIVFIRFCHPKTRYASCDSQLAPLKWIREKQ